MDSDSLKIICYTGGTCGDLITAIIDYRDVELKNKTVIHSKQRQRLKKPHTFNSDKEKDSYLMKISQQYKSIPSHDLDYHVKRKHNFISITVEDFDTALWAAKRFKKLHRPHVWQEMQRACGATTVEDYAQILIHYSNMVKTHTDRIITLESIRGGTVLANLENILQCKFNRAQQNVYRNWLTEQFGL
jgi:hypothetical protein